MKHAVSFIVAVIAGVITHIINEWLDGKRN